MGKKSGNKRNNNNKRKNKKTSNKKTTPTPYSPTESSSSVVNSPAPSVPSINTTDESSSPPSGVTNNHVEGSGVAGNSTDVNIRPGQYAMIKSLKGRTDLNGTFVTIKNKLPNGRVAVEITRNAGTNLPHHETVSIKAENLVTMQNDVESSVGSKEQLEECPICMDTPMVIVCGTNFSSTTLPCCGKHICHKCDKKVQEGQDKCPFCNFSYSGDPNVKDAQIITKVNERAESGDPGSIFIMGENYERGEYGLEKDLTKAREWYQKGALLGHSYSAYNLADLLFWGKGGPMDHKEAARWYRVATDQGCAEAGTHLGLMYLNGDGVPKDSEEGMNLLQKSMAAGDYAAKQLLHYIHHPPSFSEEHGCWR